MTVSSDAQCPGQNDTCHIVRTKLGTNHGIYLHECPMLTVSTTTIMRAH